MGDKSDEDLKFCPMLSAALSRIIKHTANDEFRDECFKMLKTNNSLGAQIALTAKLSSIASQFTVSSMEALGEVSG